MNLRKPRWGDVEHALKTGIAAAASMAAYRALRFEHGYWAVISAIIVMQANLGSSIRASTNRLIGTAIGAFLGTLSYRYLGRTPQGVGIGIAVTVFVCSALGLRAAFRLAGVTAAIVLLIGEANPWRTGLDRFLDVVLGIVIAIVISLIWPSRARRALRASLSATFADCEAFFRNIVSSLSSGASDEPALAKSKAQVRQSVTRDHELLADAAREPGDPAVWERLERSVDIAQRISDHLTGMDYSVRNMQGAQFQRLLHEPMEAMARELSIALGRLSQKFIGGLSGIDLEPLDRAAAEFNSQLLALRSRGEPLRYDTEELTRYYSFVFRLLEVIAEVHRAAELEL